MTDHQKDDAKFATKVGAIGTAAAVSLGAPPLAAAAIGYSAAKISGEFADSAAKNFKADRDGLSTKANGSLVSFEGDEVSGGVVKVNASYYVGKGVNVGSKTSMLELEKPNGDKLNVAKTGLNLGVTNKGVNVAAEVKPIWAEETVGDTKIGYGLNLDTGFKANGDGVDVSFLGFGFKAENGGRSSETADCGMLRSFRIWE
ncbi:unnamed protein product [Caenorhabditis brenneri]